MANLYFSGTWIIERKGVGYIPSLFDKAKELNCSIWFERNENPEGYWIMRFVVRVPSQIAFDTFAQMANEKVGQISWTSAAEEDFLDEIASPHDLAPNIMVAWLNGLRERAIENELLRNERRE